MFLRSHGQPTNPIHAIRLKLIATALSAFIAAMIRIAEQVIPLGELFFFRAFFGLLVIVAVYGCRGELRSALHTNHPVGQLMRSVSGAISSAAYMASLIWLPLVDVMILVYSAPVLTVVLAALVLKESVRVYRWTATAIGLVGVIITMWSYLDLAHFLASAAGVGASLALLSALGAAVSAIQTRRLTETETTTSIVFYFYSFCAVTSALTLPLYWVQPTLNGWIHLIAIGCLSAVAQLIATESMRHAAASMTAFFDYTVIIWAFIIGYFIFGELPTITVYVGGAIVVGSGIFIILRERHLNKAVSASAIVGPS